MADIDPEDLTPEATAADLAAAIAAERAAWANSRTDGAHESWELVQPTAERIGRVWLDYWVPLLRGEDGKLSLEKLKAELYDAYHLVDQARKVYRHVTGGLTDDLTASAEGIIALDEKRVATLVEGMRAALEEARGEARLWCIRFEKARDAVLAARRFVRAEDAAQASQALEELRRTADAVEGM